MLGKLKQAALGATIGIAALGATFGATPAPAAAAEKVVICALTFVSSAPLFIAADRGYYAAEGLEAELKFFRAAQPVGMLICEAGNGQSVRDRSNLLHFLGSPRSACGLQQRDSGWVGNQVRVVVAEVWVGMTRGTTLAIVRQERDDYLHGAGAVISAFQCEPEQVHASEFAASGWHSASKDRLVADDDAVFVGTHFSAPQPPRAR